MNHDTNQTNARPPETDGGPNPHYRGDAATPSFDRASGHGMIAQEKPPAWAWGQERDTPSIQAAIERAEFDNRADADRAARELAKANDRTALIGSQRRRQCIRSLLMRIGDDVGLAGVADELLGSFNNELHDDLTLGSFDPDGLVTFRMRRHGWADIEAHVRVIDGGEPDGGRVTLFRVTPLVGSVLLDRDASRPRTWMLNRSNDWQDFEKFGQAMLAAKAAGLATQRQIEEKTAAGMEVRFF